MDNSMRQMIGRVSTTQFQRGITSLGPLITDAELCGLSDAYTGPRTDGTIGKLIEQVKSKL
jgi:hypothetical protein